MSQKFLHVALKAVDAAEVIIRHYYALGVAVNLKPDDSPVTIADIESEQAIKRTINAAFPEHGFWGEETGQENTDAAYLWLVDPIDGTKSFVRGYPFFSTQIALMHEGELILGVSNAPLFGERAYALKGEGAYLNAQSVRVSNIQSIKDATLSLGNIGSLAASDQWSRLGGLVQDVNRIRGYGDFYHYHLLASGKIDVVLESDLNILDIAALTIIIREAGGIVTDLEGNAITTATRSLLAANHMSIHRAVLQRLQA